MKKFLFYPLLILVSLVIVSCEKKDEGPTGPGFQFNLDPQINKIYGFERWILDSLDNKSVGPDYYFEKCGAKNLTIGGKSNAFLSITFLNHQFYRVIDSNYLAVENGKDIYEYVDTTNLFTARENSKYALRKIMQNYIWMPRALLSKGDGAEYTILPKKVINIQADTNFVVTANIEMKAKNEGFEDITVSAGTFKTYKVKVSIIAEIYLGQVQLEKIEFPTYTWISDDIDWWVKQFRPTVKSNTFGIIDYGEVAELTSLQ